MLLAFAMAEQNTKNKCVCVSMCVCVMILWRHVRTVEGWGSSVGFCIVDGRPVCLWPICRQTSRPTTSRHIYYTTAITRGNAHPGIQPPPPSPPPSRFVHARVRVQLALRGLSRLATYSPLWASALCTVHVVRESRLSSFKLYYVFARGTSKAVPMP